VELLQQIALKPLQCLPSRETALLKIESSLLNKIQTIYEANALHVISRPRPLVAQDVIAQQSVSNEDVLRGNTVHRRHTASSLW